jgi:putative hydrolase of the HAD superfamily
MHESPIRIKVIVFDLGNTLIVQRADDLLPLNEMELSLIPGVTTALATLSKEFRLGLLSNTFQSTGRDVLSALRKLGIHTYFSSVVTSVDAGFAKPDSRAFYRILTLLDVKPAEALMVGNDPEQDVVGAHKIGLLTGYFAKDGAPRHPDADFQFSSFEDLPLQISRLLDEHKNTAC